MSSKFFKDKREFRPQAKNDWKADAIWRGLERNYPEEIKEIHTLQANDMSIYGHIQPLTESKMNAFLEKVVSDNKRLGRT